MKNFRNFDEENWKDIIVQGKASFRIARKLKAIKDVIKKWAKDEKEREREELNSLFSDLIELYTEDETFRLDDMERTVRNGLKVKMANLMSRDEVSWRQKSRKIWLKEGDCNTKYFHALVSHRRRCNVLGEGNDAMTDAAKKFFSGLYFEVWGSHPRLDGIQFKFLSRTSRQILEAEFTNCEVQNSLNMCNGDKVPGPDGFDIKFLQDF